MIHKAIVFLGLLLCFWQVLPAFTVTAKYDYITVKYPAQDSLIVQDMIEIFSTNLDDFHRQLGQYPELPIMIIILSDEEEYYEYAQTSSEIIEFSRAFYSPRTGTIYLRDPREQQNFVQINRILLHEYIHHFVNHYWVNEPLWFTEGMAVYFSGDLNMDREINFVKNYILGNSLKLEQMKYNYPENMIEWESFYAKSGLAVKYLFKNNYREFLTFWEYGARGLNFESAFLHSFYMTPRDFSLLFEDYSKKHFTTEILLASTSLIWGILPLILMIGWIRKKIIAARIKKRWENEELAERELPDTETKEDFESERI
jgi:hypothetical protein